MRLHTVFITYNRLELTQQAIASYLETVTVPYEFVVVDNASTDGTQEWLRSNYGSNIILLNENCYPGRACNIGWSFMRADTTHLHRADNDFAFLPGWCEEAEKRFRNRELGQLGLRTNEEELFNMNNVGGNCIIRRELHDQGLRYDERPWPQIREEVGKGHSEDSFLSPAVLQMGYKWYRVKKNCIRVLSNNDPSDPYYFQSFADRGIYQENP